MKSGFGNSFKKKFPLIHLDKGVVLHPLFRKKFLSLVPTGRAGYSTTSENFFKNFLHLFAQGVSNCTPKTGSKCKNFLHFLYRRIFSAFPNLDWKNIQQPFPGKKRKRTVSRERFVIGAFSGRFSPFFRSVRRFQKYGKGMTPVPRFCRNARFRAQKSACFLA